MISLSGCYSSYYYDEIEDEDLVEVSYNSVEDLLLNTSQPLARGSLVVINSLVNVEDLSQQLPFSRIVSDQISSAFHRSGFRIMGMELPNEYFIQKENGILHLSDEAKAALESVGASALVYGTFAPGKKNGYVSLRVVDIATKNVISTTDLSVPMGPDAKKLMTPPKDDKKEKKISEEETSEEFEVIE